MTPEVHKKLLGMIDEYVNSLTRAQGEKELMKCIEARAVTECGVAAKPFKVVATAYWRDQTQQVREDLDAQLAAFELVRGEAQKDSA